MVSDNTGKTTFTNELSEEVFRLTYKYGDETIDDRFMRVAETIASIEKDPEYWTTKFYEIMTGFQFVPGGRITSNAGVPIKGTTFINCFVDGLKGANQDSMEGIMDALRRQALILKSEGGYGFCVDALRPCGGYIEGIGNDSPGAVRMLDMWDTQSSVITAGSGKKSSNSKAKGKIRKGAQMVTLSCFSDTTEVLTSHGWMNIVEIIDRVGNNEQLYAIVKDGSKKDIYNPIIREPEPIFEIETEDGEVIQTTADHEFEVKNLTTSEIYLKKICDVDPDNEVLCIIETDDQE